MTDRFHIDNNGQRAVRDLVLGPQFYATYAKDGRYVYLDDGPVSEMLQKEWGADTLIQRKNGYAACVEEKIIRKGTKQPHWNFALETESCTVEGKERPGWMRYAKADLLVFAMCGDDDLMVYVLHFPKLQGWFWPLEEKFDAILSRQENRSRCRLVPIRSVPSNIILLTKRIKPTPDGARAIAAYNATGSKDKARKEAR